MTTWRRARLPRSPCPASRAPAGTWCPCRCAEETTTRWAFAEPTSSSTTGRTSSARLLRPRRDRGQGEAGRERGRGTRCTPRPTRRTSASGSCRSSRRRGACSSTPSAAPFLSSFRSTPTRGSTTRTRTTRSCARRRTTSRWKHDRFVLFCTIFVLFYYFCTILFVLFLYFFIIFVLFYLYYFIYLFFILYYFLVWTIDRATVHWNQPRTCLPSASKTNVTKWYARPSRAPTLICFHCCSFLTCRKVETWD